MSKASVVLDVLDHWYHPCCAAYRSRLVGPQLPVPVNPGVGAVRTHMHGPPDRLRDHRDAFMGVVRGRMQAGRLHPYAGVHRAGAPAVRRKALGEKRYGGSGLAAHNGNVPNVV